MTFNNIISNGIPLSLINVEGMDNVGYMLIILACALVSIAGGYFLGSVNSAIIISKAVYGKDVREYGSGNAGMTNMFRVFGKAAGLMTLGGDVGKTVLSVVIGYLAFGYRGAWLAGLFTVLGHMFPIYYRFKGGKGVLASIIVLFLTDWPVALIAMLVFTVVLLVSRMVSLGSVMAAITAPLFLYEVYAVFYGNGAAAGIRVPIAIVMAMLVVFGHRSNLKRIYAGQESKIKFPWEKKKAVTDGQQETPAEAEETAPVKQKKNKNKKKR